MYVFVSIYFLGDHYLALGSNNDQLEPSGPTAGHIVKGLSAMSTAFLAVFSEALVPDYPGYKVGCKHGKEEHDFAMLVLEVRLERQDWPYRAQFFNMFLPSAKLKFGQDFKAS